MVAGGVACNRGLRQAFAAHATTTGLEIFFPRPALCADNAAMLGVAGNAYLERGLSSPARPRRTGLTAEGERRCGVAGESSA